MTSSEAKERAAAREVDRKRTGRLGDDSVIRPSVLYTNSEVKTHPPAAAPSKLIKDLVKFDHGCLKYTVAPCKPSSSPLLNKNTAVLLGLLSGCAKYSTSCSSVATDMPLSVAPGALDTES